MEGVVGSNPIRSTRGCNPTRRSHSGPLLSLERLRVGVGSSPGVSQPPRLPGSPAASWRSCSNLLRDHAETEMDDPPSPDDRPEPSFRRDLLGVAGATLALIGFAVSGLTGNAKLFPVLIVLPPALVALWLRMRRANRLLALWSERLRSHCGVGHVAASSLTYVDGRSGLGMLEVLGVEPPAVDRPMLDRLLGVRRTQLLIFLTPGEVWACWPRASQPGQQFHPLRLNHPVTMKPFHRPVARGGSGMTVEKDGSVVRLFGGPRQVLAESLRKARAVS